ncbi:MAG: hypothetical protein NWE84_09540 [Candidatus Bathyarchaeota archaeon]|nr:hypothetical protein [Candidatus Bathyarchaeota archaeon]
MVDNRTLDNLSWGLFIILIGIGWYVGATYEIDTGAYIALGVGLILLGLNLTRNQIGIKISKLSLFVGLVALAIGVAGILGYALDLFLTVIILIGLFIIAEAIEKMLKK